MNVLEVKQLKLAFLKNVVLNKVSFTLKEGEIVAYVGRNGAGKTVTIKTIIGQFIPDDGKIILFQEENRSKHKMFFENIGYVPENQEFYRNISVKDALNYVSGFYNKWEKKLEEKLLKTFRLNKNSIFKNLSRGERSKLFLIFALSHKPKLLLLDEPTAHLDPVSRSEFWESTLEIISDSHTSIFVSTHLLSDIENIAERYLLLKDGKIVLDSEAEQLRQSVKKTVVKNDLYRILKKNLGDKIIFSRKLGKGVEIYALNDAFPEDIKWETIPLEEILIAYLKEED